MKLPMPARPLALAAVAMLLAGSGCGSGGGASGPRTPVKVLTRNLYLGADFSQLAAVSSPDRLAAAMGPIYASIVANDFPSRAKLLADEIVAAAPDLVSLQEVSLYRRQTPSDFTVGAAPNATEVMLDFLATLLGELSARGASYTAANVAFNGDAELPVDDGSGTIFDLRLTDRDVILARDGVTTSDGTVTPYVNRLSFPAGGPTGELLVLQRSWSSVQAVVGPTQLTFAISHLEIDGAEPVQDAQAHELLDGLAGVKGPVLLVGDFNSAAVPPSTATYSLLTAQFGDAYAEAKPGDPGFTCCQAGDLRNPTSQAHQRIDLILHRGDIQTIDATLIGDDPAVRTPAGLWPTDHFGVTATLGVRD